mmetsp:Transcript_125415/g.217443  ORF Transcript_125415/g.217443 Transcript_125415/m.217443 type:complete len:200 (-) Transcript_125415:1327-1926(-)
MQLYATYRGLCSLTFRMFNAVRLGNVLHTYWESGRVLTPEDVGASEVFVIRSPRPSNVSINPPLITLGIREEELHQLLERFKGRPFLVHHLQPGAPLALLMLEGASDRDVLEGFVTAQRIAYDLSQTPGAGAGLPEGPCAVTAKALAYCAEHLQPLLVLLQEQGWEVGRTYIEQDKCRLQLVSGASAMGGRLEWGGEIV